MNFEAEKFEAHKFGNSSNDSEPKQSFASQAVSSNRTNTLEVPGRSIELINSLISLGKFKLVCFSVETKLGFFLKEENCSENSLSIIFKERSSQACKITKLES